MVSSLSFVILTLLPFAPSGELSGMATAACAASVNANVTATVRAFSLRLRS